MLKVIRKIKRATPAAVIILFILGFFGLIISLATYGEGTIESRGLWADIPVHIIGFVSFYFVFDLVLEKEFPAALIMAVVAIWFSNTFFIELGGMTTTGVWVITAAIVISVIVNSLLKLEIWRQQRSGRQSGENGDFVV